jgi:peptidoglycan/LPS O-acetylase OafA/YrhL
VILIAGPKIISIAPIWGLGYFAYKINTINKQSFSPKVAIILFGLSLMVLALSPLHREQLKMGHLAYLRPSIISDYIDGIAFFIHLISMPYLLKKTSSFLMYIRPVVTWLASLTFAIYLFHLPLIRLAAGSSPFISDVSSVQHISFVFGMTFLVIVLLGIPAEHSKKTLKKWLYRLYPSNRYAKLDKDNI